MAQLYVIRCRMLESKVILCRHVIWIYSSNGLKTIPDECVVNRWCKDEVRSKMFDCNGDAAEDVDIIDEKQIAMSLIWSELGQILGWSASQEVTILPPKKSKNKGSGKRMLSLKAKAVALTSKTKRMCKNCKRLTNHDKRNCPNPFTEHPPLSPSSEELSGEDEQEVEEEEDDILE
ncbi:uncharacterized protein LOC141601202 [Silene latifolia]|uniref:uncharacterized protein LOC141601202 n=1 Tax=Silene latifolia TaxID=37657 RepID=UPI003D78568A